MHRRSAGQLGHPGVHDLADQVHRDLGDGVNDAAQAGEPEAVLEFMAGGPGRECVDAVVEDHFGAPAGDQFVGAVHGIRGSGFMR